MLPTPPTTPPQLKKIRIHSLFLHTRLPQMLPLVQYMWQSPPLLHSTKSETKTSHTPTSPLPVNSMTQTKKMCCHPSNQPCVLISPFKQKYSEELRCPSHSLMTTPLTEPSSPPSQEYEIMLTVATCTSSRLKRLSESAELSNTKEPLVMMKKLRYLLPSWTTSEGWNLEQSLIPLHHHHLLTSPFQHQPYHAAHKSWPVPRPPMPESTQWPTDRLHPSRHVPVDHGAWGLKLVTWELEYRLFQKVFESELNCCLLA